MFLYKSKHEKVSTDHGADFFVLFYLPERSAFHGFYWGKRALFMSAKVGADGKIDASMIKTAIQQHGKPFPHDLASGKQRHE